MLKVLFINPPYSPFTLPESIIPPLGLARVITASKKKADIKLLDMGCEEFYGYDSWELFDNELDIYRPNIVAVGPLTSSNIGKGIEIVKYAKSVDPSIITIFGGPDPSAAYKKRLEECKELDAIAVGESEFLFPKFLDYWNKPEYWSKIEGLAFLQKGKLIFSKVKKLTLDDFSNLSPPDWSFFPIKKYRKIAYNFGFKPYLSLEMSRGCPYECIFCVSKNVFGCDLKLRAQEKVILEINDAIESYGYTRFSFNDDNIGMDIKYLKSLSKKLRSISSKIDFTLSMRPDSMLFNEDYLLTNLAEVGLKEIFIGCESEDSKVIKETTKTSHPGMWKEKIRNAIIKCKQNHISVRTNWMIGLPEQTKISFLNTIDFICETKPNTALISVLQPYPGTDITRDNNKSKYGITLLSDNPSDFTASKYFPSIETKWLKRDEIIDLVYLFLRKVGADSIANVSGSPYYLFEYWKRGDK